MSARLRLLALLLALGLAGCGGDDDARSPAASTGAGRRSRLRARRCCASRSSSRCSAAARSPRTRPPTSARASRASSTRSMSRWATGSRKATRSSAPGPSTTRSACARPSRPRGSAARTRRRRSATSSACAPCTAQNVASDERLDAVRTACEMAAAQREQAEAGLAQARQNLADTTVRAPYRGVITRRFVDEGAMLSTMMTAGNAVVQIMKMDIVVAIVQLPELHLARVHVGTPGVVRVDGIERSYESHVAILNDRVDSVSRAFEVRLAIENADYALKPGLFAELELRPEAARGHAARTRRAARQREQRLRVRAQRRSRRAPPRPHPGARRRPRRGARGPRARRARAARPEPLAARGREPGGGRGAACGSLTSRSAVRSSR